MGKNKKERKKVVGSVAVGVARAEEADGTGEKFAVEEMGLQAQPTGAAGGSGEEITLVAATGPPALSTLDDVASHQSGGGSRGGRDRHSQSHRRAAG